MGETGTGKDFWIESFTIAVRAQRVHLCGSVAQPSHHCVSSVAFQGINVEPYRRFRGCPEISDVLLRLEAEVRLFCNGKPHMFPMTSAP